MGQKPKSTIDGVSGIKKIDYDKHLMRVNDIIKKSNGDKAKQLQLTKLMADKITTVDKAYGRYLVAEAQGYIEMSEIFLNKYNEMTQSRKDRISQLYTEE